MFRLVKVQRGVELSIAYTLKNQELDKHMNATLTIE